MSMRVVILGATGLLGSRFMQYLAGDRFTLLPLTHVDVDITDAPALEKKLAALKPDWIINGVGFLGPDKCEAEPQLSYAVNFIAARNLGFIAARLGARLIHFSTDYVFDGLQGGYGEEALARPLSVYGLHKYLADEALLAPGMPAYIFRVASLIGAGEGRQDIVKALLARVAGGADKIGVVADMEISTASALFLADVLRAFIKNSPPYGLYNVVGEGQTTWLGIIRTAFHELGVKAVLDPISASAFPRPAPRPMKSWLRTEKLQAVMDVPGWESMIRAQVAAEREMYLAIMQKDKAA
jgi:dTDP-4-dehydrorhamnose reductase